MGEVPPERPEGAFGLRHQAGDGRSSASIFVEDVNFKSETSRPPTRRPIVSRVCEALRSRVWVSEANRNTLLGDVAMFIVTLKSSLLTSPQGVGPNRDLRRWLLKL